MPKHKSEDYKLQAVKHYLKIKNQKETCRIFECSARSLMRWVKRYEETKEIKRHNRTPVSYKLTEQHIKFLKKEIKANKTTTITDLMILLNEKFKTKFSRSHINSVIRDLNITLKRTKKRHEPESRYNKPIDIKKELKVFYKEISKYSIDDIISIDETSLNTDETRKYCYEDIGKRCVIKTTDQVVFKKYTGIFAISSKGVIGYEIYDKGGIDSERLIKFLEKFVTSKYRNKLIVLDNASSHRNKNVKDKILENNHLLYSVPYQHYTNVIEGFFSVLKNKLQKEKEIGLNALKRNIRKSLRIIPSTTYKKLYEGAYKRPLEYKRNKSTREKKLKNYKK